MAILPVPFQGLLGISALMFLASCSRFEAKVDPKVAPAEATILAHGNPERVAASRDADGVQSDFLESIVLVRPKSAADLQSFLARYNGTVIGDDTIPDPPPESGITLTAEERKPTQFKVRINLAKSNPDRMSANAAAAGITGQLAFSSDAGLRTFACAADATAAGFRVSRDYVYHSDQAFPVALFSSQERQTKPGPPPTFNDPFTNPAYSDFGTTGNQSNVFQAWQFIAAHGVQRRATVAIIDNGFYLDPAGMARGTDSDFPPPPGKPFQYDIDFDDPIADGVNSLGCGANGPCWWHGTACAGAATGIANNRLGEMGTGGQIADLILLRVNGTKDQRDHAIRTALGWHADVVSMSFGGNCDVYCRKEDRNDNPFDIAMQLGNKVVFVASAGNGYGNPAVGVDVNNAGASTFIHPCIEDHVICVGALNPNANTKTTYSNFGAQVLIFAPTNIPVMSYPPSTGVNSAGSPFPLPLAQADGSPVPQTFGGTSASAPFVAGVVAMMKAVNPDLNHDAVAQILRDTARAGVAPANRMIDAYAALRRAAGASDIVKDALENNDLETIPANLGTGPTYTRSNLNIDKRDRDYFRFDSPNGSLMTITLNYPAGLGVVAVHSLESPAGVCETPFLTAAPSPIPTGGQTFVYRVPGGPLRLGLKSDDVNAYNMAITFGSDNYPSDDFEPNDTVKTARRLSSRRPVQSASVVYVGDEPRATINATIHSGSDIDFYIVQGARLTMAEKIFIAGAPFLELYGNDSLINLEVFHLDAGNSQGAPVGPKLNGVSCAPGPLKVQLDEDAYYLVKVSGSPGRYTLRNSVDGDERKFPQVVHDRAYEVLHPGDPVEQVLRFPELFVFTVDGAYSGIESVGQNVHLRLLDGTGKLVGESVAGQEGETLSLAMAKPRQIYALEATAKKASADRPHLNLKWKLAEAKRASGNLFKNPGAETVQDANQQFEDWERIEGRALPSRLSYGEGDDTPSLQDPGSKDRGLRLFASESQGTPSGIQQNIPINEEWRSAIDEGRVVAHFSAFLGGNRTAQDRAMVKVTFLDANRRPLGEMFLPTVGRRERQDKTGLFPVESNNMVPVDTTLINVGLAFGTDQAPGLAYADNLELIFSEYSR